MAIALQRRHWWLIGALVVVIAVVVALAVNASNPSGTIPGSAGPSPSAPSPATAISTAATTPPAATTAAPPPTSAIPAAPTSAPQLSLAAKKLAAMSLEQRVGQVLMVSSPVTGANADSLYALDTLHVGNVFMKGRSSAGVAGIAAQVQAVAAHVQGSRTAGVLPFVATDQEGGFVQIMRGPGFDEIPQAIEQGQLAPAALQADATRWGQQLAAAGVNVNLAPVLDTVPSAAFAPQNAPIGSFGREYGYTPAAVSSHGLAFAQGMSAAGVEPAVKHFPGLGRVTGNTDTTDGVTDNITVRKDPYVAPFQDAVDAGVPWLMISNALYPKIDAENLAPFSPVIVHDMVRGDLGFKGVIVSDDMCDAVALSAVPVSGRGVAFLAAGGTMALCTNEALVPQMYKGIVAAAQKDPAVAAKVSAAALLVLEAKAANGLIP
jgi:beta-N-acetylhexosaminidase